MDKIELKSKIEKIREDYDIDPSFLEKDVYITEILKTLSNLENDKIIPVFSGGTSLHKGHKIIKDFQKMLILELKQLKK